MRKNRQALRKIEIVIFCLVSLMMVGCAKEEESVPLTKAFVSEENTSGDEKENAQETGTSTEENMTEVIETQKTEELYVYVCGEVRNPGVYKLANGDRITHAILAAGGMTDKAADSYLNQAELLKDGQKIYVPDKEEAKKSERAETNENADGSDGKINLNTADKTLLTQLNGIGESRAEAILSYRETKGAFKSIEEIKNVDGIKDGIFEKIKDKIKVE